jgi:hypothetical protein
MSDYLSNLVARSLNPTEAIQPRLASLFEPPRVVATTIHGDSFDQAGVEGGVTLEETAFDVPAEPQFRRAAESQPSGTDLHLSPSALQQNLGDLQATYQSLSVVSEPPATQPSAGRLPQRLDLDRSTLPTVAVTREANVALLSAALPQQNGPALSPAILRLEPIPVRITRLSTAVTVDARPHGTPYVVPTRTESFEANSEPGPTIRVTVGRIEVRAIPPPARPAPHSRPARSGPMLSLEEYLKQRQGGQR